MNYSKMSLKELEKIRAEYCKQCQACRLSSWREHHDECIGLWALDDAIINAKLAEGMTMQQIYGRSVTLTKEELRPDVVLGKVVIEAEWLADRPKAKNGSRGRCPSLPEHVRALSAKHRQSGIDILRHFVETLERESAAIDGEANK